MTAAFGFWGSELEITPNPAIMSDDEQHLPSSQTIVPEPRRLYRIQVGEVTLE